MHDYFSPQLIPKICLLISFLQIKKEEEEIKYNEERANYCRTNLGIREIAESLIGSDREFTNKPQPYGLAKAGDTV